MYMRLVAYLMGIIYGRKGLQWLVDNNEVALYLRTIFLKFILFVWIVLIIVYLIVGRDAPAFVRYYVSGFPKFIVAWTVIARINAHYRTKA